jgi:hypothetical protein
LLMANCQWSGSSSNSFFLYWCYSTSESYSLIIRRPTHNLENNSVFKLKKPLSSRWQIPETRNLTCNISSPEPFEFYTNSENFK